MDNGSATEALWEKIAWMEEVLREWPSEDGSVASWVEHTMKEIQVQRSLLKTHDQFFEEKVASLKGSSSGSKSLPKIRVPKPKGFNGVHDLAIIINVADCLVDYKMGGTISTMQNSNLLCVPLDDFNLILGIDFVLKAKMALISYLGGLMGQKTYVTTLIEIKNGQSMEVLDSVVGILKEFKDVMALNKVTIKNKYPIPLAAELFDILSKASYFTKLYLRSGYWQVRIVAGDDEITTSVTQYGSYDFLVMPFGLTNICATFCNLMNDVLFDYFDAVVVVYLDDIVVYSQTLIEHEKHLRMVFQRLREHMFYVKPEKSIEALTAWKHLHNGHRQYGQYLLQNIEEDESQTVIFNFNEMIKQATELDATYGERWYVPKGGLRRELLWETHDDRWAGHPGLCEVRPSLSDGQDREKEGCRVVATPPHSREALEKHLHGIHHFIPKEEATRLFFTNAVKHFGLSQDIVSDRDAQFTGQFWIELFKLLGSELKFSTINNPQNDGQTENQCLIGGVSSTLCDDSTKELSGFS
ncbi:hypothetical protein AAG906_039033 [Vitis piasezkii]